MTSKILLLIKHEPILQEKHTQNDYHDPTRHPLHDTDLPMSINLYLAKIRKEQTRLVNNRTFPISNTKLAIIHTIIHEHLC